MDFSLLKRSLFVLAFFSISFSISCSAQKKVQIGAYYFDGWTGTYSNHITSALKTKFADREPVWGWLNSSQKSIDEQINEAANAGLSFFSFCWFYHGKDKYQKEPLNNAFNYYLRSSQKKKLDFCLTVTNHQYSEIGPKDWPDLIPIWISYFKDPSYLRVSGKPLLIFYEYASLIKHFQTKERLKQAMDELRAAAKQAGLPGVSIALCALPTNAALAAETGFDIVTGYNYHTLALNEGTREIPISALQKKEEQFWNSFPKNTSVKYIPVSTLGWDPRPWANSANSYATAPFYKDFSVESVRRSVEGCIRWIKKNPRSSIDGVALLYAWNEIGEGAWLTSGKNGFRPLDGVKKALKKK